MEAKLSTNLYQRLNDSKVEPFDIEEPEKSVTVLNIIKLNPGISKQNFWCCVFHYMSMIFCVIAVGVLQPLILLDKNYYNVAQDEAGSITSLILVIQLVVKIVVSVPYGHYADKFGRKTAIFYGAANYLASCLLVPIQTSIFPGLVLSKLLFANSAAALHAVPLIADYIADESKGKATGFLALGVGIAAMLSNVFLKILFYSNFSLGSCYVIMGIIGTSLMCINTLGLKDGVYIKDSQPRAQHNNFDLAELKKNIYEAYDIFKGNGWLLISLVLQILGSADFMVFFTFLTLYVRSMFTEADSSLANIVISNLQSLVMIPMFFCTLLYGYVMDRKRQALLLSYIALGGGTLSFILITISTHPTDKLIKIGSVMLGSTLPGLFVISNYLNIKNFPEDKRGIMIGFTGMIGNVGHFIIASGGGLLYDYWRKDGPFLVCAGLLIVAMILVTKIYRSMILGKDIQSSL